MHILNVHIFWKFFRYLLEKFLKIYTRRWTLLNDNGISATSNVLDLGCGDARFSEYFNGVYVGIDNHKPYIDKASRKYPSKIFGTTIDSIDLKKYSFDCLLLLDVVHHLTDAEFSDIILKIKHLNIKKIFIFDPIKEQRGVIGRLLCFLDRGKFIRSLTELKQLIKNNDLLITKIENLKFGPTDCVMIVVKK
jgi:SAM-dependent methyltransferase